MKTIGGRGEIGKVNAAQVEHIDSPNAIRNSRSYLLFGADNLNVVQFREGMHFGPR
jgi:hypothetical protein